MIPTLEWTAEGVRFLDQTRLPLEETYVLATSSDQVATVITTMVVRGAPAIGVAAAMGVALGIKNSSASTIPALTSELESISKTLAATRPTAVNLFWAIERMRNRFFALAKQPGITIPSIKDGLVAEANTMYDEDIAACRTMGAYGEPLMPQAGGADPLQRRGPCLLRLWHGPGSDPRGRGTRPPIARLRG
jgi:methylthioribose-1-phosphate isomerase